MTVLLHLFLRFGLLSVISFGGVNAMIAEIQRVLVDVDHWLTNAQFNGLFAVAQMAPGPNVLIATLVGLQVGGIPGALTTSVAMIGPSSWMTYGFYKVWQKWPPERWRMIIQVGIAPVTIGLLLASGYLIAVSSAQSWAGALMTGVAVLVTIQWRELGQRSLLDVLTAENEYLNTLMLKNSSAFDRSIASARIRSEAGQLANWMLGDQSVVHPQ